MGNHLAELLKTPMRPPQDSRDLAELMAEIEPTERQRLLCEFQSTLAKNPEFRSLAPRITPTPDVIQPTDVGRVLDIVFKVLSKHFGPNEIPARDTAFLIKIDEVLELLRTVVRLVAQPAGTKKREGDSPTRKKPAGKKRGRPKGTVKRNLAADQTLVERWRRAKAADVAKSEFCKDERIKLKELDAAQRNVNRHK